jgi:hypothetical protein
VIRRHPVKTLFAVLVLVCAALGWAYVARPTVPVPQTQAPQPGESLVVIGVGGLSWDDVSARDTPTLWGLLRDGSAASVSVKTLHLTACPTDGWATLGAGEAAGTASDSARPECGPLPTVTGAAEPGWQVDGFQAISTASAQGAYEARLGLLGDSFAKGGTCVQAVGPGAALAAATSSGRVEHYAPFAATDLTTDLARCPVTLVDVGALVTSAPDPALQKEQLGEFDQRIGQVIAAAPNGADFVVVGLSDRDRLERLRVLTATGPHFPPGLLQSASTRLRGVAQLSDVTATILARGGVAPVRDIGGRPLTIVPSTNNSEATAANKLTVLTDLDTKADAMHEIVTPFLVIWLVVAFGLLGVLTLAWHRAHPWNVTSTRRRVLRTVRVIGMLTAGMPAATFLANLIPWWRLSGSTWVLVGVLIGICLAISAVLGLLALRGPWRSSALGPLAALSAMTAGVIGIDLMTGSNLQMASIFGLQPLVGGRFYGMGNVAFALYAAAVLLLCAAMSHALVRRGAPRLAVLACVVIGGAALAVDVLPAWGADFGGPVALVPALGILVLSVARVRLSVRNLALVALTAVLVVGGVSYLDWLRPPAERAHPGQFVQTVIDGGAWEVIRRKLLANVELAIALPAVLAVSLVGIAIVLAIVLRPGLFGTAPFARLLAEAPLLRTGLLTVVVMAVIGFVTNDSGAAIPPVAAIFTVPLVIAVTMHFISIEERRKPVRRRSDRHIPF